MTSAPTLRRATTTVDLGDLKPRLAAVSAAAGVGPSTWLRDLVRRELAAASPDAGPIPAAALETTGGTAVSVYRAWLDAGLTSKLDLLTERGGFRSRAAALRGLLEGVNMGGQGASGAGLGDAVQELGVSNHRLVAIGRNINQIAKLLHTGGKASVAERLALDEAVNAIHEHLEAAATLVGELRPMVKSQRVTS